MARARNIKPATFKNELLGTADPYLTILFIGLWTLADRDGYLEDRPLRIKAEVFPYREGLDINGYLTELERLGFIERYEADDIKVIHVLKFSEHQNPHNTEKAGKLPEKPINTDSCEITVKEPLRNSDVTAPAVLIPDSLNTDSLLLIPDSLNTDSLDSDTVEKKPLTEKRKRDSVVLPEWMPESSWKDYVASRRSMKKHPMSVSALNLTLSAIEATKKSGVPLDRIMGEMTANGWRSCKKAWFDEEPNRNESSDEKAKRFADEIRSEYQTNDSTEIGVLSHAS